MNTEVQSSGAVMEIAGLHVTVVRKAIKNVHLAVYPPNGWVRAAVPLSVSDAAVRVAVIGKLRWIRQQQEVFASQVRQAPREMVSGESHFYLGRRYRLEVIRDHSNGGRVVVRNRRVLELRTVRDLDPAEREQVLARWYRDELRALASPLVEKWQALLGVQVAHLGIKRMKTKWGSCNAAAGRVWLNLELIKKDLACIEYVVVHELAHLRVRLHDARFVALMDKHLPRWRSVRELLNSHPLASETWGHAGEPPLAKSGR